MHESEKWKWSRSVVSDSSQPHRLQPTRLLHPWGFPGKSTGVGCHCLLGSFTANDFIPRSSGLTVPSTPPGGGQDYYNKCVQWEFSEYSPPHFPIPSLIELLITSTYWSRHSSWRAQLYQATGGSDSKEFACNTGGQGSISVSWRSSGEGNGMATHSNILAWRIS